MNLATPAAGREFNPNPAPLVGAYADETTRRHVGVEIQRYAA